MRKPSVYQRESDGRWVGAVELDRAPGEKRKRKVVYGNSEKEVWEKLNEILYEIQTGEYIQPSKDTLIDFLKNYHVICTGYNMWDPKITDKDKAMAENAKWEETTAELFKMYIDVHFEPYFKDIKLKDVKTITLDTFYNYKLTTKRKHDVRQGKNIVSKELPPLSINSVIKLNKFLKAAFNYAIVNDKIKKNPTDGVKLGSPTKFIPNVYDKDKFLKLLDAVRGTDKEIPVMLGAGCGLRRGEICGLTWEDIDFKNKTISIKKTQVKFRHNIEKKPKTETSERKITVSSHVLQTLKNYYLAKGEPPLTENVITLWKPQSLSGMFSDLLKEHGLEHIRLHDLRHYNAVIMLKNGISDKVAAERLGHANVSTLREVYQHVLKEMDEEAADKIDEAITPAPAVNTVPLSKEDRKKMFKVI